MNTALEQHQIEIERNRRSWESKPLLRKLYAEFYREIIKRIDRAIPGRIVELGSGIGNLKQHIPEALSTDLFPNPWLDLSCDAYSLPFRTGTLSHLILFDVFHHLERPFAFLVEARRVLTARGCVILFEPFISVASAGAYGIFHHEPVAWRAPINRSAEKPKRNSYYAAQGNATRLFFRGEPIVPRGWSLRERRSFSVFAYLFSGGFSKPALYPSGFLPLLSGLDRCLTHFPKLFGGRCLVVLEVTS